MEPFIGELRIFGFGWSPMLWAACEGQLMQIVGNRELFSIIGTTYGGNGVTTFALPDLRGRVPMHGKDIGTRMGALTTTLKPENLAPHVHNLLASPVEAKLSLATDNMLGSGGPASLYASKFGLGITMAAGSVSGPEEGNLPIDNMQPYLGMQICIAIKGIFPSRG